MTLTSLRRLPDTSQTMDLTAHRVHRDDFAAYQEGLSALAREKAEVRQHSVGKLTARERIAELLDDGSFTEIGQFAGGNMAEGYTGAGVITGFGTVSGDTVAVYAQDFSIRGGTLGKVEGDKIIALMDKALELRIPVVAMLDSGGARIQEGVIALSQYGRIFKKTCEASGVIPQVSVILGPCAGGAVYCPALTDFIVMTRDNSHMFVTGPDVVRATTGEDVSFEDLGGAVVHNFQSGVAHYLADDEADALDYTRTLLTYLPANCDGAARRWDYRESPEDAANAAALSSLVPESSKQPYDMTDVIRSIVDYGEFVQVQELFAPSIVVGFACMDGESVGIVANQPLCEAGTLDVDASEKAGRFVQFCDAFNVPVVTLVDVPGYRPGTEQEQAGIIRRGANLVLRERHRPARDRRAAQGLRRRLHRHGLEVPGRRLQLRLARRGDRRPGSRRGRGHHRAARAQGRRRGGPRRGRSQEPARRGVHPRERQPLSVRRQRRARRDHHA